MELCGKKLYSDNGTEEVINSYEGTEIELEVNALAPQDRQILFGQLYENGFLVKTADDKAPEVAVGWRERKLNGKYDFKWLYAGKFAEGISEFPFTFNVTLAVPVPFAVTLPLAFTTATLVFAYSAQVIPLLCPVTLNVPVSALWKETMGYPVHRKSRDFDCNCRIRKAVSFHVFLFRKKFPEESGIPLQYFPAPIEDLIRAHREHPDLVFGCNYHFTDLSELTGELHIIGMSPNNDGHIFKLIDESKIDKIVFYYYSEGETKRQLPVHQKVEYKSAKELWKQLKAAPKQYNCNYHIPKSDEADRFFELFNILSGDKVSRKDVIANANSIPEFRAQELCKTVVNKLKLLNEAGAPKDEQELQRQFREISRMALRNGVLPPALYLHVVMYMSTNKLS